MKIPENKKNRFERNPKKTLLIVVIAGVLLTDFLFAFFLVPTDFHPFRAPHPYYHHQLLPNQNSLTRWGPHEYSITTNSLGFRDSTTNRISLKGDKPRILLMGDSHTEAVGMEYEQSFAGILANHFAKRLEILNAGAVSYSPKLYYLKTKYLLEEVKLNFDAIYLLIDISDIQNEFAYEKFTAKAPSVSSQIINKTKRLLFRHSYLLYSLRDLYRDRQRKVFYEAVTRKQIDHNNTIDLYETFFSHFDDEVLLGNPQFHTTLSEWYSDKTLYERWGKKGVRLMDENMQKLVNLCNQYKIDLTISVHPWRNNIRKGNPEDQHVKHWRNFARKNDINFINLYALFLNGEDPDRMVRSNYLENDNHWNANGHKAVAQKLIDVIDARYTHEDSLAIAGMQAFELNQFDLALNYLGTANNTDSSGNLFIIRGKAHLKLGQFEAAKRNFQIAKNIPSSQNDASRLLEQFEFHKTIILTTNQIEKSPNATLFISRGEAFLNLNNYIAAMEDFHAANRVNKVLKEPYYYLGLIEHRHKNDLKKASSFLNRAIQLDEKYSAAYAERSVVLEKLGNIIGSERDLQKSKQ